MQRNVYYERCNKINKQKMREWSRDKDIAYRVTEDGFESEFKYLGEFTYDSES